MKAVPGHRTRKYAARGSLDFFEKTCPLLRGNFALGYETNNPRRKQKMNNTTKYALVSLVLLTVPLTNLSANRKLSTDYPSEGGNSAPVAIKTVTPVISQSTRDGLTVEMKFKVNREGRAVNIRPVRHHFNLDPEERDLATAMQSILSYWRFEPARDSNGRAIAAEVVLPIKFERVRGSAIKGLATAKEVRSSVTLALRSAITWNTPGQLI